MKTTQSRSTAALAALGVAALAAASVAMISGPAFAAPGAGGDGTLTVHKLEQPESGDLGPNDGSEIEISGAKPLVAGFTACTIEGIDLAVSSEWDRLKDIVVTLDGDGKPIAKEGDADLTLDCSGGEQMTEEADGTTVFDLPADRAYVVYESTPAPNAVPAAEPTVITIPYPGNGQPGQPEWNYAPHIYPKNAVVGQGASKDGKIIGDKVTFDVTVPINRLAEGADYTEFRINDQLSDSLQYTEGSVVFTDSSGGAVTLTKDTDYTLSDPSGSGGDEVVLTMLAPGLTKLNDNIGGELVLTIKADAISGGSTENEAKITVNGTTTDPGPSVVDPEDFFGGAHIMKEAKNKGASENVPLAGAKFDVYTADSSASACPAEPDGDATKVIDGDVSGDDGTTPNQVLAAGKYCVYETGVPAGYKGMNGGMLLNVTEEGSSVTVVNTQVGADEGDLPSLPITGALGNVLLIGGGALLLALAGWLIVARRKRQQQQQL